MVKIKRVNMNARLSVRDTTGVAGYDLAIVQAAVVLAHGKCLVKTSLAMALPTSCYGRIARRSGLALKKFIDVGAGVIDADYRGEVGAVLFNLGNEDFVENMGDRIAQLIFEKIKTPTIQETDDLEGTNLGAKGYGSIGVKIVQAENNADSKSIKDKTNSAQDVKRNVKVNKDAVENETLSQLRQLITARQMSKLAKGNNPVFLAIIRETNESPQMKKMNKRSSVRAAHFASSHGMSEGTRRSINKK